MNALTAWLWHFVWPSQPPPRPPSPIDGEGGSRIVVLRGNPGLFIENRAGIVGFGDAGPVGPLSGARKGCHATGGVDRDPYALAFPARPLELDPYAGELVLCVEVGADGHVARTVVVKGSGHADSDRAAIAWLRALRFEPAVRHGGRVAAWRRMTLAHGWPYSPPPR